MKQHAALLTFAFLLTVSGLALTGGSASAQPAAEPALSFDLRDAPLPDVLAALHTMVPGFQFTVKGVEGKVTAMMARTTLAEALRKIVEDVNASYKVDQGIYVIEKQATGGRRGGTGTPLTPPRPPGTTPAPAGGTRRPTPPRRPQ